MTELLRYHKVVDSKYNVGQGGYGTHISVPIETDAGYGPRSHACEKGPDCDEGHVVLVDADEWEAIELVIESAFRAFAWWEPIRGATQGSRQLAERLSELPAVMNDIWASYVTLLFTRQEQDT
jgi:hypothetical protein